MKDERFTGFNVDLERLAIFIKDFCEREGFETRMAKDSTAPPSWFQIQAHKKSFVRTATGTRRSLDVVIKGHPEDFEVAIGTGEWGKNIVAHALLGAVTLGGALLAGGLGTIMYKRVESKLWKKIKQEIEILRSSSKPVTKVGHDPIPVVDSRNVKFCVECGAELPRLAKFCEFCGTKLK